MSYLDEFCVVTDEYYYITLRDRSITFSASIIKAFQNAPFIQMLVNKEKNEIAFRLCEEDAEGAMRFYKNSEGRKSPLIRIAKGRLHPKDGWSDCDQQWGKDVWNTY